MQFGNWEINKKERLILQAFGRVSSMLKDNNMPTILKRKIYNQCTPPIATYSSETGNLKKGNINAEHKLEKKITQKNT